MESDIQRFFKSKTIFLTGGTGFLGKVFIEKTLRLTEVERIYVLVRPKRGKNIDERIKVFVEDPLFNKLHELKPNAAKRITFIAGECGLPDLGLSNDDRTLLIENTDVVVHSAASVRFDEPLSKAISLNVRATQDLLQLARRMLKLKSFVHVSSVYANFSKNRNQIDETYYSDRLPINAVDACKLLETLGTDLTDSMSQVLCKDYPNTYCFTKALSECAVLMHGSDLPICIFRPGIVTATSAEPIPGWIDSFNGHSGVVCGIHIGLVRVLLVAMEANAHIVPVDFCINAMLACALNVATSHHQIAPPIYNLVPEESNKLTWSDVISSGVKFCKITPMAGMLWFPFVICTSSMVLYRFLCFLLHSVPGYVCDFVLFLRGKPRRFAKLYAKVHKNNITILQYIAI